MFHGESYMLQYIFAEVTNTFAEFQPTPLHRDLAEEYLYFIINKSFVEKMTLNVNSRYGRPRANSSKTPLRRDPSKDISQSYLLSRA
jgi:hypothetical protein